MFSSDNLTIVVLIFLAGKVVQHSAGRFLGVPEHWNRKGILHVIQEIGHEVDLVIPKLVMRILRHAVTGMKV